MDSNQAIIHETYYSKGSPGSFHSAFKLSHALKQKGYNIPLKEIQSFLNKQQSYFELSKGNRINVPSYLPIRTVVVSKANHYWHGGSITPQAIFL